MVAAASQLSTLRFLLLGFPAGTGAEANGGVDVGMMGMAATAAGVTLVVVAMQSVLDIVGSGNDGEEEEAFRCVTVGSVVDETTGMFGGSVDELAERGIVLLAWVFVVMIAAPGVVATLLVGRTVLLVAPPATAGRLLTVEDGGGCGVGDDTDGDGDGDGDGDDADDGGGDDDDGLGLAFSFLSASSSAWRNGLCMSVLMGMDSRFFSFALQMENKR